jgi:hypothetical protein
VSRPLSKWVWGGAVAFCTRLPTMARAAGRVLTQASQRSPNVRMASRKASPKSAAFFAPTP